MKVLHMTNGSPYNHAFWFHHSLGLACPKRGWTSLKQCNETHIPTQTPLPSMGTLSTPSPPPHQPLAPHRGGTIEVWAWLPYEWAVWGPAQAFVSSLCVYLVGFNPNPPVNPTHVPIAPQNLEDIWSFKPTLTPKPRVCHSLPSKGPNGSLGVLLAQGACWGVHPPIPSHGHPLAPTHTRPNRHTLCLPPKGPPKWPQASK